MKFYEVAIFGANIGNLIYNGDVDYSICEIVRVPVRSKVCNAVILGVVNEPKFKTKDIIGKTSLSITSFQLKLAQFIADYYICSLGLSLDFLYPIDQNGFKELSFYKLHNKTSYIFNKFQKTISLNDLQQKAKKFCLEKKQSLIFGDTGSGKSEIYISILIDVLNKGKQGLFLMPEISLTPQMSKRLKLYFGESLEIWHSKITKKKKEEILKKIQLNKVKLIAGARSALFLPFTNLGVIIVDEEHDASYKNEFMPCFNTRDMAILMAKKQDILCILGSATPSLTTIHKQPYFRIKGTFFKTEKQFIYEQNFNTEISQNIITHIRKSLQSQRQVIVFLPIRANFKKYICPKCLTMVKCPNCDVAMSLHSDKNYLQCHYCGYTKHCNAPCEICGNQTLEGKRVGTTEIANQLKMIFGESIVVEKFDRDNIKTIKQLEKILTRFNNKEIDILVGTQMLSKGHDYHNVDLAIILGVDNAFAMPDFKARENVLSTVIQVAGRAGRAGKSRVLIQSIYKDFFENFIQDYDNFLKFELEERGNLYPPNVRLLRILITHKNILSAEKIKNECINRLQKAQDVEIIGQGMAGIKKIKTEYRFEILLRSKNYKALNLAARMCVMPNVCIDVDPINFA